ncbi:MAG: DUF4347 domain-containing protein [Comamonadaceae bacterium]
MAAPSPRRIIVEALEPRLLLSAEGLLLPPAPPKPTLLDTSLQAGLVNSAQLAAQLALPLASMVSAAADSVQVTKINEVIFLDPGVVDGQALVRQALANRPDAQAEVVLLDGQTDGIVQITSWLKMHQGLQAVHLLSHGDTASLKLGSMELDAGNIDQYQSALGQWQQSLKAGADLFLYGCDVAQGASGSAFVDRLSQLTGAVVAASTDATGSAAKGGNWVLEKATGPLESSSLFAASPTYDQLLAAVMVNKSGDTSTAIAANNSFKAASNLGAQLDVSSEMAYTMPLADLTFAGLIRTNDGRTLGDVLAFKTLNNTSVLDDYLATSGTHDMSGLMGRMGDYLNGVGAYSNLESVVDHAGSSIAFSATGQVLTANLTLSREFVQQFGFGEQLKALGLGFQAGQGIPLLADVHFTGNFDLGAGTISVSQLDAQIQAKSKTFTAGMALGVVAATASGTLEFDTGKLEFSAIGANVPDAIKLPSTPGYTAADNLFTVKAGTTHAVKTNASFDISGDLGGTSLATIAGGTPHIDVAFGGLSLTSLETSAPDPVISGTATLLANQTLNVEVAGATYTVTPAGDGTWSLHLGTATPSSGSLNLGSGVTYDILAKVVKTTGGALVSSAAGTIKVNPTINAVTWNTVTPTLSGVARLATGQTLSVSVGGAVYAVTPAGSGAWSLDLGTATASSGTLTLANSNSYTMTATVSASGASCNAQLTIDSTKAPATTLANGTSTPGLVTTGSVAWNALQPAPLTLTASNFSSLQALSSLTSTQLVKMLQDLATYLGLLRDSGQFDALLPFTSLKLGDALDFGAAINDVINNQLATTLVSGMTASKAISPVLGADVVFDLQVQLPGDERVTSLAISVARSETTNFTHINQLAALIGQKITAAVNGWLAWTGSAIEVTESLQGGLLVTGSTKTNEEQTLAVHASSGTYQLNLGGSGASTGDISVLATPIELQNALEALVGAGNVLVTGRPKHYLVNFVGTLAGTDVAALTVASSALTAGSMVDATANGFVRGPDGTVWGKINLLQANPGDFSVFRIAPSAGVSVQQVTAGAVGVETVQRLFVIHAGDGSFILTGDAFSTGPISLNGLSATDAQLAILNAFQSRFAGMSVSEVSGEYAADNGTRVFDIGFGVAAGAQALLTADTTSASVAIAQTAAGDQSNNAVQTLTVNKSRAGAYVLKGSTAAGTAFATNPIAYGATATAIQTELSRAIGLPGLTVTEAGTSGVFTVTLEKRSYAAMTASNVWTSQILAQAVLSTQQIAADAVGSIAAKDEIQQLTIANATGGSFVLGITLDSLLFETGNISYGASAADVQASLVAMLQKWNATVTSSDISVSKNGNVYAIEFKGRWAAKDVPQMRVNSQKLTSPAGASFTALDRLGFLAAGQDSQVNNVTTFVTLDDMVERFKQAVNVSLSGAAFDIKPTFDLATKSFLFAVKFAPVQTKAVPLAVAASVGDLSGIHVATSLDLTTQTLFQGTIGFDFSKLNTFALRASGTYTGTITASASDKSLTGWSSSLLYGDAPFNLAFNGEGYDLTLLQSAVGGNTTRDQLVADLQSVFAAQAVAPGGVLARRGFANLGQVVTVGKKADGQLTLTINAPVDQVQLTISAPSNSTLNAMDYLLGFKTMPTYPAPKSVTLPANGQVGADAHFSLKVDQSAAIAVTVSSAATGGNATTAELISDINAALNSLSVANHAYLGTGAGGMGFTNLGQVIQASLRNGQIELVTQSAKIASLQIQIDGADPATRVLGFTPGQFATTGGAYVFLQDVTLGGNYSAVVHGQVGATPATLAAAGQATLGMLDITFGKLGADYQGSFSFNLRNGLTGALHDRVGLNELFDSASAQDGLLGLGGALSTSDTVSSPNAPYQSNGQLLRDVGLSVTVGSAVLDVVVKKSDTTTNNSVTDLAADVNAAIHAALLARFTTDPYAGFTFVSADSVSVAGKTVLKFAAPTSNLTLAGTPSQIYNASTGVLLVDLPLTVTLGATGATVNVLVSASNTETNTSLAELVIDVDNTIKLALASARNNTSDAAILAAIDSLISATDLVGQTAGALTLKSGTVAAKVVTLKNLAVAGRLLSQDYSSTPVFLNQAQTAGTTPTAALTLSDLQVTTPAGVTASGLNPATTLTVSVTNTAAALAGTAIQASSVLVPSNGLGSLTPLKGITWADLHSDMGQLGSLLGDLGGVGAFGELGRALPVLGSSVSDLFNFTSRFAAIDKTLGTQSSVGLNGLQAVLGTAFGVAASDVSLTYDNVQQALNINVPYRVVIDTTAQIELILNDAALLGLLSATDKKSLTDLLGSMSRLKDADSSSLLKLHADMTFHLAMGVDLSTGANQGRLFLYDHVAAGAAGFADDTGTYATLNAFSASASGVAFDSVQGIYSLGVTGGTASVTLASTSGLMLHSDAKDGAADGRLYLRNYGALSTADETALRQSNFDVVFDGAASVVLPLTLKVSDDLGQLAITQIDGFLNPLPLGKMEISFVNLGDTFAQMGGKPGFTLQSSAEGSNSHTIISSQVVQAALPPRPATGNGSAVTTPEGAPVDSADESGLAKLNPNPYFGSADGTGASTTPGSVTVNSTKLFGAVGASNASSSGFDVSLIVPDLAFWQTQLTRVLNAAVADGYDPDKLVNGPLIFLLRDPTIIVNTVDKVLGGIQDGLDAFSSVLNLPIIGDQLKQATQFVADLRSNVVGAIKKALDGAIDVYGGLDNALRMMLFKMLDPADTNHDFVVTAAEQAAGNPFLNFLQDYNGDGLITPDDIVVEYIAGTGQPSMDSRLADYLGVTQTGITYTKKWKNSDGSIMIDSSTGLQKVTTETIPVPAVLPGQRTAWVTSGINVPKLDSSGNPLLHEDGTPRYTGKAGDVVLDSSLQKIVDDVSGAIDSVAATAADLLANVTTNYGSGFTASASAFAKFVIDKVAAGYDYGHLLKDVFGTGVIAASLSDVAKTFKPSDSALATDAATLQYNKDHNLTGSNQIIPKAVLGEFKKAIQARAERIGAQLALGSSTAIQFRMHLGQTFTPNLDLSFNIGVPGLSLTMDGGIGLKLNWNLYLGFGVDIKDGFYLITNMPGTAGIGEVTAMTSAGVATGTKVNNADAHIDNLWLVGKPTFTPMVKELQASIDVFLTPGDGNKPASLNAQFLLLNGTLTDNWDGWIKDNDTGIWGSGTDSLNRLTGTQTPNYGRTTEMFNGLTGADGSRTRLHLDFSVDLKDVGLFGISALSGFTNGRLTYSDLRNAKLSDLYKVEWEAKAQINLHMALGISINGDGYLPKIVGDFHLTWQDSNKNKYVKQINQYFSSGYDKLFHAGEPNIWMTDVYLDVGTFFTKFLMPIVKVVQDVTSPIKPVLDALTTPIPGLSDLMGRDYSTIDLATDMSSMFGGISEVDFIIAMVNMLEVLDNLPSGTKDMLLPVKEVLIISGSKDRKLNLSALPDIGLDVKINLPYEQMANVNVAQDGFEFGLNMGVGWKDNPNTSVNEAQTTLLKVIQGQTPDLSFDFSLTADARIPAPYVDVTPFDFTIPGIKNRDGLTDATFKLNIKAGWPDLRLSDILSGNMAPQFVVTLVLPDIDFTPNLLPILKFVMPKLVATFNGKTYTLLGGQTLTVDWPTSVQGFVNTSDVRTFTGPTADINLGNLPDFLLPLPYVDLTPIDISANVGVAGLTVMLNVKAGWHDMWLSDLLRGNIAPSFDATLTVTGTLPAFLPVLQVKLPQMTWTMGAKTWTWAAGGTKTIAWPTALTPLVDTNVTHTIDLSGAGFNVNLGTISGFLPTIKVEWPDVHWIGPGKEFVWHETSSTDLGWSSIISDNGILSALIDPSKSITIKLPDVWLPSINLLDLLPNIDWGFSLPGLPSLPSIDISLPSIDMPGQQTISPSQAFADWKASQKKPGSALKFPILEDTVGSVIGLLMGKPVDLVTFTPPNLKVKVGFRVTFPVYPPLDVGIGGEIKLSALLSFGFDTYGITKFAKTHHVADIFDGFYISDNIVNGVDKPEVTLTAKLYAFAELNAFIVRGGVEGGIKLVGTLDIYDEDKDNKFRASEIIAAVSEDPLDVVEMHLRGSAYISAYVDVFAFVDYVRVWEWTFMDVTLFTWEHDPAAKKPILASLSGTDLTLHMGSTIGSIDGQDSIDKGASDRKRRSTDDGNESYTLTGSGGTVNISAILTNGNTYTKTFAGVSRVKAFSGAGDDLIDASALDIPVLFIAGSGKDVLKGGSGNDVLIGSDTGTATLMGGGGNDLLIARGGITHMQGGTGDDTYRFLADWGIADIIDASGANILDFTAQTKSVTLDDSVGLAFEAANKVTWTNGSDKIDLVKGGTGSDILDFSGDAANLLVSVTGTNAGWVKGSGSGMTETSFASTTAQSMKDAGDNAGYGFKFKGFENIVGGQGSDVFRISDGASLTGSMQGNTTAGLHHDASGDEVANARNILDFSEYTSGVVVNEESSSAFGTANASNIIVRGFHDIFGGSDGDRLSGDGRNNLLVGNDGTDMLEGKAGHDLLVADTFVTYQNLTSGQTRPGTLTNVTDYLSLQLAGAGEWSAASRNWIWKGQTLENKSLSSAGAQTLKGGSGNDIIMGSKGGDIINIGGSGEGNDTIMADLGKLEIDFNYRTALSATSYGSLGGGNDTIYLGSGNNLVIAGNGKDSIIGADVANSFNIVLTDNGTVKFKTAEVATASGTKLTFSTVDGLSHLLDSVDAPVSENGGTGGADTVSLSNGSAIVLGGSGNDTITFGAYTSTGANVRFVAGDHASIRTDAHGGITEFYTLDTLASSGGDDVIVIGSAADLVTRHLGTNYILGGMGADTIIVSGAIDSAGTVTRGQARSEDVILGDNGKITRTASVAATSTPNRMLKVESTQTSNGLGGNDKIIVANGGKLIIGGVGDDTITAQNGDNLIIGDNGQVDFDASNSGILRKMQSTAIDQGGNDTINLGNGYKAVIGGFGADVINILADNLGEAVGPITVTGLAAVTGTAEQRRSRGGRFVAGDNAQIDFDIFGGVTDFVTLDAEEATGGADAITIKSALGGVDLGLNVVLGGMGSDVILMDGASYDPVSGKLIGGTDTSDDILMGDNGEVHRTATTSAAAMNLMLQVKSIRPDRGGDDLIGTGNGGKVIVGGLGADKITAVDGDKLVLGDNGQIDYDAAAQNGLLRTVQNIELTLGGADTIRLGEGFTVALGGIGSDSIEIAATGKGSMTAGFGQVTGFDAAASPTDVELRRQTGRFIAGDNAIVRLDPKAGITDFDSIDAISATGGDDSIIVGKLDTTADLGYQVIYGGMGSDAITVRSTSTSEDIIFGDNAQYRRKALSYQAVSYTSVVTDKGGDDRIVSGRGFKTVVGGFGSDRIDLAGVMVAGELTPSNRALILGDSGAINFDFSGSGSLKTVESLSYNFGGSDVANVGDGDVTFIGGYGADTLNVNSTQKAFRAAAGDNARLTYSSTGSTLAQLSDPAGLTNMISLDTTSITGDSDVMRIGPTGGISGEMGVVLMMGGMGRDTLTVTGASADQVMLAGDNADVSRTAGRTGLVTSFLSLLPDQGAGDTLETVSGNYLLVGGQGGDSIRAGSGYGVVFGDSGRATFNAAGKVQFAASVGTAQGGNDSIALGSSGGSVDGDKVVVGGYGSDTIDVVSVRGNGVPIERTIAGDNASMNFDSAGRLTAFATQDPDASTGGSDNISISMAGDPVSGNPIWDYNVIAGGAGNDTVQVFGAARSHDVLAGDNLDYRRSDSASGSQDLFAEVLQPTNGADDVIRTGSGIKLILGGIGADRIDTQTQPGDSNVILGDAGAVTFDPNATGKLLQIVSTSTSQGGNDTLNIGAGKDYVLGGFGNDAITVNAGDNVVRAVFGDNGQIDFDPISGAMAMVQSTGSDLADPASTADALTLPSTGTNLVIGGTGLDTLSGSLGTSNEKTRIPGSGAILNAEDPLTRVISIIMLGKNGEFGITAPINGVDYVETVAGGTGGTGTGTGGTGTGAGGTNTSGNNGSAVGTGAVQEDVTLTATGRLAYRALTGGFANFVPLSNQVGSFGQMTLLADGNWTYTLSNAQANVQGLKTGETRADTFIANTTDGSSTTITITVSGTDDVAVLGGVSAGSVTENATTPLLITSGVLTITTPDAGQARFSSNVTPMPGALGALTISDTGHWEYRVENSAVQYLGAGQQLLETFTVSSIDASATKLVSVTVTGVNDAPTGSVTISGPAIQGLTLTASNTLADADGIPGSGAGAISYQWYRGGAMVAGATQASYTLSKADLGSAMNVVASYTDLGGTAESVSSVATLAVAKGNDLPAGTISIRGTPTQGQTLTANIQTDANGIPLTGTGAIAYQWQAGGVDIAGANANTLLLGQAQVGKVITVVARYVDGQGAAQAIASGATASVANVNDLPTGTVTISGTAAQGQTLSAANTLADADGIPSTGPGAISYQWQAGGVDIAGANSNKLVLGQAQVGEVITVVARYTDAQGTAESVTSSATSVVASLNSLPTGTVTISGTATQGQTLSAANTLADADGIPSTGPGAISYQWQAGGVDIAGANSNTLVLGLAQVGKAITVVARYTDAKGTAESVTSSATSSVAAVTALPTVTVTISGTATQGQTLTVATTPADGSPGSVAGAVSYQWYRNGAMVAGATQASYTLTQADVGSSISVVASYTDLQGKPQTVTGGLSGSVLASVVDQPAGTGQSSGELAAAAQSVAGTSNAGTPAASSGTSSSPAGTELAVPGNNASMGGNVNVTIPQVQSGQSGPANGTGTGVNMDSGNSTSTLGGSSDAQTQSPSMPGPSLATAGQSGAFFGSTVPSVGAAPASSTATYLGTNSSMLAPSLQPGNSSENADNAGNGAQTPNAPAPGPANATPSGGQIPGAQLPPGPTGTVAPDSDATPAQTPAVETPAPTAPPPEPAASMPALGAMIMGATALREGRIVWDLPRAPITARRPGRMGRSTASKRIA